MKKILCMSLLVIVGGCAGAPLVISSLPPEKLKAEKSYDLCNTYAYVNHSSAAIKDELISRGEIDYLDWRDIDNGRIKIGMSEIGLICAKGDPKPFGGVRTSVSAYGTNKQYFYRNNITGKMLTVIIDNDKVSNYQE